jgi:hypothetical protein
VRAWWVANGVLGYLAVGVLSGGWKLLRGCAMGEIVWLLS